jgi:hypothetical protein
MTQLYQTPRLIDRILHAQEVPHEQRSWASTLWQQQQQPCQPLLVRTCRAFTSRSRSTAMLLSTLVRPPLAYLHLYTFPNAPLPISSPARIAVNASGRVKG